MNVHELYSKQHLYNSGIKLFKFISHVIKGFIEQMMNNLKTIYRCNQHSECSLEFYDTIEYDDYVNIGIMRNYTYND